MTVAVIDTIPVLIREAEPTDLGYVIDTFGKTLRPEYRDMRTTDFAGWSKAHLQRLLHIDDSWLFIAHPPTEPEVIWGYAFGWKKTLHFAYVREAHRRGGILRKLLGRPGVSMDELCVTHITESGRELKRAKNWRYVPMP